MKILHVLPPVKFGGGESILVGLASLGRSLGHDEKLCSLYQSKEFENALDNEQIPWVRLSDICLGNGPSRSMSKIYAIGSIFKLPRMLQMLKREAPDVIHLHGFPSSLIGALIKKWSKLRNMKAPLMVYTHHAVSATKGRFERRVFDWIYKEMDFVTGVSQASVDSLLREHGAVINRISVIENFAAASFYEVGQRRQLECQKRPSFVRFINVARFIPLKNQIAIVDAVSQLSMSERERIQVIFVGDGETLCDIKSAVRDRELVDFFEFKGFVQNKDIPALLAEAEVMIFPSKSEGAPIAVAEGLAAGLPVLGLEGCDGVVQVAGDAGYFVEERKLVNGMRYMLDSDLPAISKKARMRAKRFDPAEIKKAYLEIYRHAIPSDCVSPQEVGFK